MLDLVRARRDHALFLLRAHPTYAAGIALFLAGVLALVWQDAGVALGVVGVAASVVVLLADAAAIRRQREDVYALQVPLDPASVVVHGAVEVVQAGGSTGSLEVDLGPVLRRADPPVHWRPDRFRLRPELRALAPAVLRRRTAQAVLYNGRVVRLGSDLHADAIDLGEPVELQGARYFDGECSNELVCWEHRSRSHGSTLLTGRSLLTDAGGRLRLLSESWCANLVGVSTVAITPHGELLLTDQSARSGSSPGLVAPSGSGSLEPVDVRNGDGLVTVVARGMERELEEEWGLLRTARVRTSVTGFARWWDRGGKPEFLGVSVADLGVAGGSIKGRERLYVAGLRRLSLTAPGSSDGLAGVTAESVAGALRSSEVASWSLPLALCLRSLALALDDDPGLLLSLHQLALER